MVTSAQVVKTSVSVISGLQSPSRSYICTLPTYDMTSGSNHLQRKGVIVTHFWLGSFITLNF